MPAWRATVTGSAAAVSSENEVADTRHRNSGLIHPRGHQRPATTDTFGVDVRMLLGHSRVLQHIDKASDADFWVNAGFFWNTKADALANRDFIYLVVVLSAFGKAHWFLSMAAVGAPAFFLALVAIDLSTRRLGRSYS